MPQRSPIIFWLLLAATITVDAVALASLTGEGSSSYNSLVIGFHGLIIGQLGVVCIWSALKWGANVWMPIAPLIAVAFAAFASTVVFELREPFRGWRVFTNFLGYFGLHAVVSFAAMWLLQRTAYWQRRTGITRGWQFSLFHILTVMTLVGVLLAFVRDNMFLGIDEWANIAVAFFCVVLATSNAVLWSFSWNWFLRLASVITLALLAGVATMALFVGVLVFSRYVLFSPLHVYYFAQTIVLSLWLGLGPILPLRAATGEALRPDMLASP